MGQNCSFRKHKETNNFDQQNASQNEEDKNNDTIRYTGGSANVLNVDADHVSESHSTPNSFKDENVGNINDTVVDIPTNVPRTECPQASIFHNKVVYTVQKQTQPLNTTIDSEGESIESDEEDNSYLHPNSKDVEESGETEEPAVDINHQPTTTCEQESEENSATFVGSSNCVIIKYNGASASIEPSSPIIQHEHIQATNLKATNQGKSNHCTIHAIAKAVSPLVSNIEPILIVHCLNQLFKVLDGIWPQDFNNREIQIEKVDDEPIFVTILVQECKIEDVLDNHEYVLVYHYIHENVTYAHSMYIEKKESSFFKCINSWGDNQSKKNIPFNEVTNIYKVDAQSTSARDLVEPTIKRLTFGELQKIAKKLDFLGCNNWFHLGMKLVEEVGSYAGLQKDEVRVLEGRYCGGGSPSLALFTRVSTKYPDYTLNSFVDVATKLERNDIVKVIREWKEDENKLFCDIGQDKLIKLARLTDLRDSKDCNWRYFADEMKFSHDDINTIEESIKSGNENGPALELLELIKTKNPDFKLYYIRKYLNDIGRNDVIAVLDPIIDKYKNEKVK